MKNPETKPVVTKIIVSLLVAAAAFGIGIASGAFASAGSAFENFSLNGKAILRVILMAGAVIAAENVLKLILSLGKPKSHRAQTIISLLDNMLRYVAGIVILCWGLSIFGADVGTIVAGMGILALIIGFGANSLISDLVTGLFMIFENQYNVGDFIEVGGFRGKVTSIGIRTTCIEDPGGNVKIINNSDMNNVLNRSDHSSRAVSSIGIPYETDLEALEAKIPAMMDGIFERHSDIMLSKPVYLGVDALSDSSVDLKFVAEVNDKDIYGAARALNRELFLEFRKAGVEVPFPQVDVHQK